MKRLTIGLISLLAMLIAGSALADVKQETVPVKLVVNEIIRMQVTTPPVIIPVAEDYEYIFSARNDVADGSTRPSDIYGFASRHTAIKVTIFTNARSGATVYFAGKSNPEHNRNLQLQDIYLSVIRDETYVLRNSLAADWVRDVTGGIDGAWAIANTTIDGTGEARWIQAYTEAKKFFGVTKNTPSSREWFLQLGIASLAEYEANLKGYEAELTFILMPVV